MPVDGEEVKIETSGFVHVDDTSTFPTEGSTVTIRPASSERDGLHERKESDEERVQRIMQAALQDRKVIRAFRDKFAEFDQEDRHGIKTHIPPHDPEKAKADAQILMEAAAIQGDKERLHDVKLYMKQMELALGGS